MSEPTKDDLELALAALSTINRALGNAEAKGVDAEILRAAGMRLDELTQRFLKIGGANEAP